MGNAAQFLTRSSFRPEQPAIDKHAAIAKLEQVLRPGDSPAAPRKVRLDIR
jgi:hypothetical protein